MAWFSWTQNQLFSIQARTEEERAALQSEVEIATAEMERAQQRLMTLETEKQALMQQVRLVPVQLYSLSVQFIGQQSDCFRHVMCAVCAKRCKHVWTICCWRHSSVHAVGGLLIECFLKVTFHPCTSHVP